MSGFFGSDMQQRLQAEAEARTDYIKVTPGACQTGRMFGCEDVDRLGWDVPEAVLHRDGFCGFRMIPIGKAEELGSRLGERGFQLDLRDVFTADRQRALPISEEIVRKGRPDGLRELEMPTEPAGDYTRRIQSLMADAGVVPFSGSLLTGRLGPATTVVVGDSTGAMVAAAHGHLPHNSFRRYHGHGWGGLVAVAEEVRGRGLGSYVNARMIVAVFRDLATDHIYEVVSATNKPSRRMVETCGLELDPTVVCGIASRRGTARFTR
jgi:RimJ/RimL family protein N-acetyltransferase